jgi:hypothetical protein
MHLKWLNICTQMLKFDFQTALQIETYLKSAERIINYEELKAHKVVAIGKKYEPVNAFYIGYFHEKNSGTLSPSL